MHMLTDVGRAGAHAVRALDRPTRPASAQKTFGYYRAEILAALVNGVVLCVLVLFIVRRGVARGCTSRPRSRAAGMLVDRRRRARW